MSSVERQSPISDGRANVCLSSNSKVQKKISNMRRTDYDKPGNFSSSGLIKSSPKARWAPLRHRSKVWFITLQALF